MSNSPVKRIEAHDYALENFFDKASSAHRVPALQRPYTWGETEVVKFVNDIVENDPGYYIGSVVMVAGQGSVKRDEIIDGQQRITSIYLLLIALRSILKNKKVKNTRIEEEILNYLIKPEHRGGVARLTFTNQNSNTVFECLAFEKPLPVELNATQQVFVKNLKYIEEALLKAMKGKKGFLEEIMGKIRNLQIIFISCFDKSSAYVLFESINATGLSLASTDLIKNGVFYRLASDPKKLELVEQNWQALEEVFDEDRTLLKTFIRHEWISNGNYTSHEKIYSDFDTEFSRKSPDEVEKYVSRLVASSKIYASLRGANVEVLYAKKKEARFNVTEVKEALEFLSFLGVDQVYSVLLNIFIKKKTDFRKGLTKLAAFQFLFKYLPGSPSTVERKFAEFCSKGDPNKLYADLQKMCENKKSEFVEVFLEKIKYREGTSGDVQYVLQRLSDCFDKIPAFKKPTIEHIIPSHPEEIPEALKKLKKGEYKRLVNLFGNLTVVEKEDNSSGEKLGNKHFSEKRTFFQNSGRKTHEDILAYSENFEDAPELAIQARGIKLANDVYDLFLRALKTGRYK